MKKKDNRLKTINKTAKILAIGYILFLSLFALDVFEMNSPWYQKIIGLLIHLIPNYFLLAITIIAWKKPKEGGILFIIISILFTIFFKTYRMLASFLLLSIPLLIIGILFIVSARYKIQKETKE